MGYFRLKGAVFVCLVLIILRRFFKHQIIFSKGVTFLTVDASFHCAGIDQYRLF